MTDTYRYGYGNYEQRLTEEELMTRWSWRMVHPELRRRALSLCRVSQTQGADVGIGGGARDPASQLQEALKRHTVVSCSTPYSRKYNGVCYKLKPGMSPYAFPGSSNHETGILDGYALAIDFIGWETGWFVKNCVRFGIKHFEDVNNEPWHGQPVEFSNSRSVINQEVAAGQKLPIFKLPEGTFLPTKPSIPVPTYPKASDMFVPIHPKRNSDTRVWPGPLAPNVITQFALDAAVFPENTVAIAMNVTAVGGPSGAFLTIWGSGQHVPNASILNFTNGSTANGFYVGPVANRAFMLRATGGMHVICDITGYWTS